MTTEDVALLRRLIREYAPYRRRIFHPRAIEIRAQMRDAIGIEFAGPEFTVDDVKDNGNFRVTPIGHTRPKLFAICGRTYREPTWKRAYRAHARAMARALTQMEAK